MCQGVRVGKTNFIPKGLKLGRLFIAWWYCLKSFYKRLL